MRQPRLPAPQAVRVSEEEKQAQRQATGKLRRAYKTLTGVTWLYRTGALAYAVVAAIAFQDIYLGLVIAAAMIITILVAAVTGSLLPSILRRLNIDPAIAGGVVLTTITDVTAFFVFLGLASLVYA